jgi:hypothetical protein
MQATILNAKNRGAWALMLTLALGAVVVALIAIFSKNETTVSFESPQTINGATSITGSEPATETLIQPNRGEAANAPTKEPRVSDSRGSLPVRYEIRRNDTNEEERLKRDEDEQDEDEDDKQEQEAERARKEEKKRLERRRKKAEKLAERRREAEEERTERRPRLVGIYTERP